MSETHVPKMSRKRKRNTWKITQVIDYNLSNVSRYFCFLISKQILVENLLSSILVKPDIYFSASFHSPFSASSSKYSKLKKRPDSRSSLSKIEKNHVGGRQTRRRILFQVFLFRTSRRRRRRRRRRRKRRRRTYV